MSSFWRTGYAAKFAKDVTSIADSLRAIHNDLSMLTGMQESIYEDALNRAKLLRRGIDPNDSRRTEERFPGDIVAQVIFDTLCDRGNTPEQAQAAMDEGYDYDPFGRIVDEIENLIPDEEMPDNLIDQPDSMDAMYDEPSERRGGGIES